ncbi:MAG: hypothetical protein JSV57_01495 [Candidatus Bathyarchaeota archaeon]|nr:MAG: hypothetical protein JSV57_01495 [Candidatus Bathyarchaeota archaeon]
MKVAKSYVGRNVNLHLKDNSVIINVVVTDVKARRKNPKLHYRTPKGSDEVRLRDLDWVQPLNPFLNAWGNEKA